MFTTPILTIEFDEQCPREIPGGWNRVRQGRLPGTGKTESGL